MEMTKREVKAALGLLTDAQLAREFVPNIGRWAVGQWPEDKPIPELRQYKLREKYPSVFGPAPERKKAAKPQRMKSKAA